MEIFKTQKDLELYLDSLRLEGKKIALVPTMGGLHDGHLSLVDKAKSLSEIVVVSIFVNPTQFARGEDFDDYPNTFEADKLLLESKNVDALFLPSKEEIYPHGTASDYKVGAIGQILCGAFRPTHFDGVAQVVKRFFEIVKPDLAVFGEKDFQQLLIIKTLVKNLSLNLKIESIPTQREDDGLAMSTRNQYLSDLDRERAPHFYSVLCDARDSILRGNSFPEAKKDAIKTLGKSFEVEYLEVLDANNLTQIETKTTEIIIISAIRFGGTRLIDNLVFRRTNV
jgi:pantoate--beta-alanine ligase|tara:strand:+ start:2801 stop:3646 length:846 start_codon:yes stop_codon:yes gene_type:complete